MNVRGIGRAALAAVLVLSSPAGAQQVNEATWSRGWRAWGCESGRYTWNCQYWFHTEDCTEAGVGVTSEAGVRFGCFVELYDAQASIQYRLNSAGRRVGCLSTSGSGYVNFYSAFPEMSFEGVNVPLDVHDGLVVISHTFYTGQQPTRAYRIDIVFDASCGADTAALGDIVTEGSVTVDVA